MLFEMTRDLFVGFKRHDGINISARRDPESARINFGAMVKIGNISYQMRKARPNNTGKRRRFRKESQGGGHGPFTVQPDVGSVRPV